MPTENKTITLHADGAVRRLMLDGHTNTQVLENATGRVPAIGQIRVNGAEIFGDLNDIVFPDGALVQVMAPEVAAKGVAGA